MIFKKNISNITICFVCLLFCSNLLGQNKVYDSIKKLNISDELKIIKLDSLLQKNLKKSEFNHYSVVSYRYASWLFNRNRVAKSFATLNLSIKHDIGDTISLQRKYYKQGFFLTRLKQLKKSIKSYKNVITLNNQNIYAATCHQEIAKNLFETGDYSKSVYHFEIAEKLFLNLKNYKGLVISYNNAYNAYNAIKTEKSRKKLLKNLLKADSLSNKYNFSYNTKYTSKRALGKYYTSYETRDTIKGQLYLNDALLLALEKKDSSKVSETYSNIGLLYDDTNPKKSISYHKKALKYSNNNNQKAIIYSNLGLNNVHLRKLQLAIKQQHKAVHFLTGNDFKTLNSIQQKEVLKEYYTDANLWKILSNLSESYLVSYEYTKDKVDLKNAIKYSLITDDLIDIYNNNIEDIDSRLVWRKAATEIYSRSLRASFLANDFTSAFRFMEKNKALILYEENATRKQKQALQLPENLVLKELSLQQSIQNLSSKKEQNNQTEIANLKNTLSSFRDSLQTAFPNYTSKVEKYIPKPVVEIQEELKENQAILEYHITIGVGFGIYPNPNKAYGILITKEEKLLFEIKNMDSIKMTIEKYLKQSRTPLITNLDKESYKKDSHTIFKALFPVEIRELIKNKELTIIPDNYLNEISFESLITSNEVGQNKYLILHNQINYQYSYTFHHKNKATEHLMDKEHDFIAFAPVSFENSKLPKLQNSIDEVENIATYFDGKAYMNGNATKQAFMNTLGNAKIIHLATHANANDSIVPWIAFSDGKVYLDELSLYQNNASLVVLSACNTSTGKIETGEGTMSLSRGFFYGGAQSSISSLWKADDKATVTIMNDFYKNLSEGQSKGTALHNSKLNYLNTHYGYELSPYYWAPFVLTGDTSPLPEDSFIFYYVIGFLLIGISIILYIRKQKKGYQKF